MGIYSFFKLWLIASNVRWKVREMSGKSQGILSRYLCRHPVYTIQGAHPYIFCWQKYNVGTYLLLNRLIQFYHCKIRFLIWTEITRHSYIGFYFSYCEIRGLKFFGKKSKGSENYFQKFEVVRNVLEFLKKTLRPGTRH